MLKEVIAICPECEAKNILPAPEARNLQNPGHFPLAVKFDCFKCKQNVGVLVANMYQVAYQQ